MTQMEEKYWDLGGDIRVECISMQEFRPLFSQHRSKIFGETLEYNNQEVTSDSEKEKMKKLGEPLKEIFTCALVLAHKGQLIGWSFGRQETSEKFYQVNSAVFPAYRGKGLYKKLLKIMLEIVIEKGFQIIYSRHAATNSEVIVPKLRMGFVISSFELSDSFGTLVHLSYFTNPVRRKIMDFRCGQLLPDAELRKLFRL